MKNLLLYTALLVSIVFTGTAEAVQTKLVVRAKSKDAKFVGTSMGGASVVVKDSKSGEVLAEGTTSGATGNTRLIMVKPVKRGARITDESTAGFETVIDIDEPRLITIEVEAPNILKPDTIKSSTQVWLIPGKDITGDGVILEVPGFAVTAEAPQNVTLVKKKGVIPIMARVVMI